MKKFVVLLALAAIFAGCTSANLEQEPTKTDPEPAEITTPETQPTLEKPEAPEPTRTTSLVYENEDCGFVMSFPEEWSKIGEIVRESDESTAIYFDLTSTVNPELTMTVLGVRGDHSRYETPIGATEKCVLYVDEAEEDASIKEITNTFAVVNGDLAKFSNEKADFSFEYPKELHLRYNIYNEAEPAVHISLGDEINQQGYVMDHFAFAVYIEDYNQWMIDNIGGPFIGYGNACEEDVPGTKEVFGCENLSMGITEYFALTMHGDLGYSKYYQYERKGVQYPSLQFTTDLYTQDYSAAADSEDFNAYFLSGELTPQQEERLAVGDSILKTVNF